MKEIIRVKCLKHIYPDKTEVKVCGLDFVVNQGERVAILGENGSGKTTLLNHILGLLKPVEGQVSVFDKDPVKSNREVVKQIGVVFQNVDEQIIGPTVYDDIAFAPLNHGYSTGEVGAMVEEVSQQLGIGHLLDKIPHYLSGGQKKKVALAGAMVLKPRLLILDEPFNGLDPASKDEITRLLNQINNHYDTSILVTSHDINRLAQIVDKAYIIHDGHLVRYGAIQEVLVEEELLYQVSLRPPILVQLFSRLKAQGVDVDIPLDIVEAEKEITRLVVG